MNLLCETSLVVMPGLVPVMHAFLVRGEVVDGRNKSGHDGPGGA
jgi:hypothetical protein